MISRKTPLSLYITLLFLGIFTSTATAQTVVPKNTNLVNSTTNTAANLLAKTETATKDITFSPRVTAGYTTQGAGFNSYGSFEGFFPVFQTPGKNLTFVEGKLLYDTENGTLGGNVLLGQRFLNSKKDRVMGGYVSYDTRDTGKANFNQLGLGLESLSENWDFHLNGYIPLGKTSSRLSENYLGTSSFQGNNLQLDRVQVFQESLAGVDAEVGKKLASLGNGTLRGYAGTYLYGGEGIPAFVGVKGKLVTSWDNLAMGLSLQSDSRFDTRLVFNIGASLGGHGGSNRQSLPARMGESVERESNILVDNRIKKDSLAAINPVTGQPWVFNHANLGVGTGNGTYENPTGTVTAAIANAQSDGNGIVYVQSGTNPGTAGFTVPNKVQVLSTGPVQTINTTQLGSINLPGSGVGVGATSSVGAAGLPGTVSLTNLPKVTGTITLAANGSDQVLSGFAVTNTTTGLSGIIGTNNTNATIANNQVIIPLTAPNTATSIVTANRGILLTGANSTANGQTTIDNNVVNNAIGEGIRLENVSGKAFITRNTVANTIQPYDQTGLEASIYIRNNKGDVDLTIANNTVGDNNTRSTTGYNGVVTNGVAAYTPTSLVGNEVDGIEFSLCRSYLGGLPDTFAACSGTATAKVKIANNTVRNVGVVGVDGADGIDMNLNNGDVDLIGEKGARVSSLAITGNNVFNIGDKGVSFGSDGDAVLGLGNVSNNTVTNVGGIGIALRSRQTSNTNYVASGNTITKAAANGIEYSLTRADNSAVSTAVIDNNKITDSGPDAIFVRSRINGQAKATITNNTINSSGLTTGNTLGIEVSAEENSKLQALVDKNTITGTRAEAILIRDNATATGGVAAGNAQLNAVVTNNKLVGNNTATTGAAALTARANSNANMCLRLQNNTAGTTAATGYFLNRAVTTATANPIFRIEDSLLSTNVGTFTPALPLPTAATNTVGTNNFTSAPAGSCGVAFAQ